MARRIITLLTDFGNADGYAAVMKGVILSLNPDAVIVDVTHEVRPQAIAQAAFLLGAAYLYFPPDAIHVVVVDPGVGTARRPLLLTTPRGCFVAPDNGVLSYVLRDGFGGGLPDAGSGAVPLPEGFRAFVLDKPEYWLHAVSRTFHGRDVFAPAAAHLSNGVAPESLGSEARGVACLPLVSPRWERGALRGEVVHVDRFGNLITSIPSSMLPEREAVVEVKGRRIEGLSASYAEREGLLAIAGSHGYLEIAFKNGSAARELRVELGEAVAVRRGPAVPSL